MTKANIACAGLVALALTSGPALAQDEPVELGVASFSQASSWYAYAVGLADMLRKVLPEGSVIDAPPEGGGTANALLIDQGNFDLAFGMGAILKWAENGEVVYDAPIGSLRALVGGLDQYYLGTVATGDQPDSLEAYLESNPDVKVVLRQKGSAGGEGGLQMLAAAGHPTETIEGAGGNVERVRSFGIVKDALVGGQGEFWVHTVTRGHPAMTEIAETTDLTFLQPSEEVLQKMQDQYGWVPATMPSGTFRGLERDVTLPGTTTVLFAREDLDDDLAYTITKTICENIEDFQAVHKALSDFTCENAWKPANTIVPLHPGAERYYKESGFM